jgi:hypothetical protein
MTVFRKDAVYDFYANLGFLGPKNKKNESLQL